MFRSLRAWWRSHYWHEVRFVFDQNRDLLVDKPHYPCAIRIHGGAYDAPIEAQARRLWPWEQLWS